MKVLISAYVCAPGIGSEFEVAWQWAKHLSRFHEIVVLTKRPLYVDKVNELLKEHKNLRFEYYDLPKIFDFMRTGNVKHFLYYNLWQIGAYFHAKRLVQKEHFDLVHHLVYVNTWQPTYMGFLGIPFLFGPVGENPRVPPVIARHYGAKVVLRELLMRFVKYMCRNVSPLMRAVYNRADKVIVINSDVYSKLGSHFREKTVIYPAIGAADSEEAFFPTFNQKEKKFRALYVGRFVYLKCPDLALEAFLKFADEHNNVEFTMIGGGRMQKDLEQILEKNKNANRIKLIGWIDRKEVMEYMRECDVFLFPTFEGGGMVVLEAMSYGKPVICMDFGGPKDFVTDECGIKVAVSDRTQIIADLADALEKLYNSGYVRQSMGVAAKKRTEEHYVWERKVKWMNNVYLETLDAAAKRP